MEAVHAQDRLHPARNSPPSLAAAANIPYHCRVTSPSSGPAGDRRRTTTHRSDAPARHGLVPIESLDQRLKLLVASLRDVSCELTVPGRVRLLTERAAAVGNAAYAAFAVKGPDGTLDRFVFSSYDPTDLRVIQGALAVQGIAGADLLPMAQGRHGRTRLAGGTPSSAGGRIGGDFLDLPVETPLNRYGHLYVMRPMGGAVFSEQDRQLLTAFVESGAIGIDNAGQLEEAWRRQQWLIATGEISRRLLAGVEDEDQILSAVAESVQFLTSARTVTISIPSEDDEELLDVRVAAGVGARELVGRRFTAAGTLPERTISTQSVQAITAGDLPCVHLEVDDASTMGQIIALPLRGRGTARGAIVLSRHADQPDFSEHDIAMASDFATQATLALELAEARAAQQTLEAREDRERIAESLQDQVVQRLFSIGLSLQSTAGEQETSRAGQERVSRAITDINDTIRQVRASIDPLMAPRAGAVPELHTVALAAAARYESQLGFRPAVRVTGSLEKLPPVQGEVQEVLRTVLDALVNHGRASHAVIELGRDGDTLVLTVADDGVGFAQRGTALAALWEQATRLNRTLSVEQPPEGGLQLRWSFPA